MMMTAILALMLAGALGCPAFAQAPQIAPARQTPAPAPTPVPAPSTLESDLHHEFARELTTELEAEMKELEREMRTEEFTFRIDEEKLRTMGAEMGAKMAALARQFPIPPVATVPRRDPREQRRELERAKQPRRRFPEGWVESTEPFSRTFKVGKGSALMVANIAGNIQISPGGGDQIEVQALKHAWGPNAEQAKQHLADAVIQAYATGNRVELRVEHAARKDGRGVDVEFDVKVPADASVEVRTVSGDMRVTNVKGEIRVQGVSGNLALEGTPRLVMVKSVSGDISLTNAGADAQLSVSTVNGDLLVQTLTARSLDLNTVNGDIRIGGWSGDRAHIRTLDGDLDLQTSLIKGGRYEIESHSGDVQVSLPEQPGFELETHTFSGRIRIDFPIRSEGPIRDNDRGPRSVRGSYGDGSSILRVQTFSGDLTITRR